MSRLIEQIKQKDACAFTHGGKFHADDVFSSALLLYICKYRTRTCKRRPPQKASPMRLT